MNLNSTYLKETVVELVQCFSGLHCLWADSVSILVFQHCGLDLQQKCALA